MTRVLVEGRGEIRTYHFWTARQIEKTMLEVHMNCVLFQQPSWCVQDIEQERFVLLVFDVCWSLEEVFQSFIRESDEIWSFLCLINSRRMNRRIDEQPRNIKEVHHLFWK